MTTETRSFLEALFAGKPENLFLLLWTLPEKRSQWFRDLDAAIQCAESSCDHDLYVGVGLSGRDYGASHRCVSAEVAGIVGLWADLDLKSDAHPKAALPATVEDAMKILPDEFPPTFVVRTGNGAHAGRLFSATADLGVRRGPPQCQRACAPLAVAAPSERRCPGLGV